MVIRGHTFPSSSGTPEPIPMHKTLLACLAASFALAEWTNAAAAEFFSKTGPVIAIMADELFVGEAEGHLSGAGTIAIRSQRNPDVTCVGKFTSSAILGGSGQMLCSNGTTGAYRFKRLSLVKGYGAGSYHQHPMSFTYGLTADESMPYLKLPPGKKLEHNGISLVLADISPAPTRPGVATGGGKDKPAQ
jgi:hypothetical protein